MNDYKIHSSAEPQACLDRIGGDAVLQSECTILLMQWPSFLVLLLANSI